MTLEKLSALVGVIVSLIFSGKYVMERRITLGQITRKKLCTTILELFLIGTSAYILLNLILLFTSVQDRF